MHSLTRRQFRFASLLNARVFKLWEEAQVPGENPRRLGGGGDVQTQARSVPPLIESATVCQGANVFRRRGNPTEFEDITVTSKEDWR